MSYSISINHRVRRYEKRIQEAEATSFRVKAGELFGSLIYTGALVTLMYVRPVLLSRIVLDSRIIAVPILLIFGLGYLARLNGAIGILGILLILAISKLV